MSGSPPRSAFRWPPARWLQALAFALLSGCGSYFEPGDEAWIELPGAFPFLDEYAVVEVVSLADGRARVELIERHRVVPERARTPIDSMSSSAKKLLQRLEDRGSARVSEDDLITPTEGELDLEAKRQVAMLFVSNLGKLNPSDVINTPLEVFEITEVEDALRAAEQRGLDDETRALELLLAMVERRAGIDENELEKRASAVRASADLLRERLAEDRSASRRFLKMFEDGDSMNDKDFGDLLFGTDNSYESLVIFFEVASLLQPIEHGDRLLGLDRQLDVASALTLDLNLIDQPGKAVDAVSAILEAANSIADLATQDGRRKFLGESRQDLIQRTESELALSIAKLALGEASGEDADSDPGESAEAGRPALDRAREIARPFDGTLDIEPVWRVVEADFYREIAKRSESVLEAALHFGDLGRASEALDDYIQVSQTLGSLYARHEKSRLNGANAKEHAENAGRSLFRRVEPAFLQAATAFLGTESADFDSAALAERETRLRELAAPFNAALGTEVLDASFLHEARETAKANSQRKILQVGQVWKGAVLCGEATGYRQYRAGSDRRGAHYHGPERLALTLELIDTEDRGARMLFQGKLTAENLPTNAGWRSRKPETGNWIGTGRPASTQFVALVYHPRLLTVEINYGVVDRASHIERYGESRHYVGNVEGSWHQFYGQGTMAPSPPEIKGRMERRYIDDTCTEFSLAPSQPSAPEFALDDGEDPEVTLNPIAAAREAGGPPSIASLTEQTYLGGMKKRGMKVFALSASGDWCASNVAFKIEAESGDVFSDGTVDFYMKQFGRRINDEEFCPAARTADLIGYAGASPVPCFNSKASAADEWRVFSNGPVDQCD